jgi:hypothetical protein
MKVGYVAEVDLFGITKTSIFSLSPNGGEGQGEGGKPNAPLTLILSP